MKNKKSFIKTFIAVIICAILAVFAISQYQIIIAKSKFSDVKKLTEAITSLEEKSFIENGKYITNIEDLNLDKKENISCDIILVNCIGCSPSFTCHTLINNIEIEYTTYFLHDPYNGNITSKKAYCSTHSINQNNITNKICQQETGKTAVQSSCSITSNDCSYAY